MNCTEFESILADYIDGTLGDAQRAMVDEHAASCANCREFMAEVGGALKLLKSAPEVEPPPALITRIAFQAPRGRVRHPADRRTFFGKLASRWLQPVLQPRLVMGMAMTLLSFSMLERCTGVRVEHIQAADLSPARVWDGVEDKVLRVRDRVVKSYENLRVVYEIETRMRDLQDQQAAAQEQALRRRDAAQKAPRGNSGAAAGQAASPSPSGGNQK